MKTLNFLIFAVFIGSVTMFTGCGTSTKNDIRDVSRTIDSLKNIGVPDTILTDFELARFSANNEFEKGSKSKASQIIVKAKKDLEKVKAEFSQTFVRIEEKLNQKLDTLKRANIDFTGIRHDIIGKSIATADSLVAVSQILKANSIVDELIKKLPKLIEDEKRAKRISKIVQGDWIRKTKEKNKEDGSNFNETEEYIIKRNGKIIVKEFKKGYHNKQVYMDYKYTSYGTYKLNGDTVKIFINRIKGYNKNKLLVNEAKKEWKKVNEPPFDSLVTNGSEDRFQTYRELSEHFKKR